MKKIIYIFLILISINNINAESNKTTKLNIDGNIIISNQDIGYLELSWDNIKINENDNIKYYINYEGGKDKGTIITDNKKYGFYNLIPNTEYIFKLQAIDENEEYSNILSVITKTNDNKFIFNESKITSIFNPLENRLLLSWTDALGSIEKQYEIYKNHIDDSNLINIENNPKAFIKNILPNRIYKFIIRGKNKKEYTENNLEYIFVSPKNKNEPIWEENPIKINNIYDKKIDIEWKKPINNQDKKFIYHIYQNNNLIKETNNNYISIGNLEPNTDYFFSIIAIDQDNNKSTKEGIKIKTKISKNNDFRVIISGSHILNKNKTKKYKIIIDNPNKQYIDSGNIILDIDQNIKIKNIISYDQSQAKIENNKIIIKFNSLGSNKNINILEAELEKLDDERSSIKVNINSIIYIKNTNINGLYNSDLYHFNIHNKKYQSQNINIIAEGFQYLPDQFDSKDKNNTNTIYIKQPKLNIDNFINEYYLLNHDENEIKIPNMTTNSHEDIKFDNLKAGTYYNIIIKTINLDTGEYKIHQIKNNPNTKNKYSINQKMIPSTEDIKQLLSVDENELEKNLISKGYFPDTTSVGKEYDKFEITKDGKITKEDLIRLYLFLNNKELYPIDY